MGGVGGRKSMHKDLEVRVLRKIAADNRTRALSEPDMAATLLEIAANMDASATKLEPLD